MESMCFGGVRRAQPRFGTAGASRPAAARLAIAVCLLALAALLPACSSGGGGSNGAANPRDQVTPQGLNFSYPYNGELDVVPSTRIVLNFPAKVSGAGNNALKLQDTDGNDIGPDVTVVRDGNQPNILRVKHAADLLPNTNYQVVAGNAISAGATRYAAGDVLFKFRTRPLEGRPAKNDFAVTSLSPGENNPLVPGSSSPFTEFNPIRVVLNEPVDPATVTDDSFIVTGPDGQQITTGSGGDAADARLTASGRYIVFDPKKDFAPGKVTIKYTDAITSAFGKSLQAGSTTRTVLDVGKPIDQTLVIEDDASAADVDNLADDFLGGLAVNNVHIVSQLIGSNNQPVIGPEDVDFDNPPIRNRLATTLATPGQPGFGNVFPAVIRAGQKFQLTGLTLKLGGGIPTPIVSGPIDVNFPNDVNVYLMGNDYRNIETPTAVRLRLDLSIGTLITAALNPSNPNRFIIQQLANGVFNQSVLNIQAAGLAIPRDNGDLEISTLGSFPINVNRSDNATVDFGLTLVLPAEPNKVPPGSPTKDSVAPFVTAVSPSACLYAFGSPGYNSLYQSAAPTALPEPFCLAPANGNPPPNGGLGVAVNSFPIGASPAVTFSSPIDPATVNASSIQLTGNGTTVPASYYVRGFSVVVDPDDLLAPGRSYKITVNAGATLKDLAGNAVSFDNAAGPGKTISFTTEPLVDTRPTPALLGTLTPGIPCALAGGDFKNGGDNAGNCANNADNDSAPDYPVFESPVDIPVNGIFSKFVETDSVKLADGCLTAGSGQANTVSGASVALQKMNGGQCVGTPDAALAFANPRDDKTRAFSIRPVDALAASSRYWVVICGADGTSCVNNAGTITDADGLALNTNPLASTGSTPSSADAAGGPDILMPFDTTATNADYYTSQFTLPETDTNGNGLVDAGEIPQPGNRALVTLSLGGNPLPNPDRDDGKFVNYLALARPIALRALTDACGDVGKVVTDDGRSAVGGTPNQCIPASLLPGGINSLTNIGLTINDALPAIGPVTTALTEAVANNTPLGDVPVLGDALAGTFDTAQQALTAVGQATQQLLANPPAGIDGNAINTGRILLRFPNDDGADGGTQTGYIVAQCKGAFGNGLDYDFEPCFTASLNLVANAPDSQLLTLQQQRFTANVVGPVTFEQNGRLVISLRNVNTIQLNASALGALPAAATIAPADLNFQLVGNAIHGGRAFPNR